MNQILKCKYPECNKFFLNSIMLPCGKQICQEHIQDTNIEYKCIFCNDQHNLQNLSVNSEKENLHLNENEQIGFDLLKELKSILNKMESLYQDPSNFIYDYFSILKNEINKERNRLKLLIDKIALEMINELNVFENKCLINFKNKYNELNKYNFNETLEELKNQHLKWENKFKMPSKMSKIEIEELSLEIQQSLLQNKNNLNKFKRELLIEKQCNLKIENLNLTSNQFAQFSITEINSKDSLLFQTLTGHSKEILSLAVLPNGQIVSGSDDNFIKIWHPSNPNALKKFSGHKSTIWALVILPNGNIASASDDKTIKIWHPSYPSALRTLKGHTNWVRKLVVLAEGYLASGSGDSTIKIWDLNNQVAFKTLIGHTDAIYSLAVLHNGYIASGSGDNTIKIWDKFKTNALTTLTGHTGLVRVLIVLPNGNIASGSNDNNIKIWDQRNSEALRTLSGHTNVVYEIIVLQNGNIASASGDKTIKIWDPSFPIALRTLIGHTYSVRLLALLPNGNLVSGSDDTSLKIWNPNSSTLALKTLMGNYTVYALKVLSNGNIAAAYGDNTIKIWDV